MTPYQLECDRLADVLPADDTARLAYFKRRAPLGDLEFYAYVFADVLPYGLENDMHNLLGELREQFNRGRSLAKYRAAVRDWLRRVHAVLPPTVPQGAYAQTFAAFAVGRVQPDHASRRRHSGYLARRVRHTPRLQDRRLS